MRRRTAYYVMERKLHAIICHLDEFDSGNGKKSNPNLFSLCRGIQYFFCACTLTQKLPADSTSRLYSPKLEISNNENLFKLQVGRQPCWVIIASQLKGRRYESGAK